MEKNLLDILTNDVIKFLEKEFNELDSFKIKIGDTYGNQEGETCELHIVFDDNNLIAHILISVYYNDLDKDYDFEFNSMTLSQTFSDNTKAYFFINIKQLLDNLKKFNYVFTDNSDKNLQRFLHNFPIFNKENYNKFVDEIISKKMYLYKYVNKKFLKEELIYKYKYLEFANNFDLI